MQQLEQDMYTEIKEQFQAAMKLLAELKEEMRNDQENLK